jgi:MFS family permease
MNDSNLLGGDAPDTLIPIGTIICNLMKNCSYLLFVTAITVLMFVQTANIYWATDYMKGELKGRAEGQASVIDLIFLICILTAPFIGSILGGVLITKLGGYTTRGAFIMVLCVYLLLLVACIPISFVNSIYLFGSCLWLVVFVFGFTEPILTGIMLNMVSPPERSTAISVTIFLQMIFGLLPAPYVYGLIYAATSETHPRYAMRFISFTTILGGVALFLSFLLKNVSVKKNEERVKNALERTQIGLTKDQIEEIVKNT